MKKIILFLACVLMTFSAVNTLAAETGNMNNFKTKSTYSPAVYTDVAADSWYNGSVKQCYELALMLGNGNGRFNPEGNVTLAEAITMASRVHNIYAGSSGVFDTTTGANWYDSIVQYAVKNSIIKAEDFSDYNVAATRAEMAYIFSNALPKNEFDILNDIKAVPDMKKTDMYYEAVLNLYNSGVLVGSDSQRNFLPQSSIKRCEAAAIICRVAVKDERVRITEEKEETPEVPDTYDEEQDTQDNEEQDAQEKDEPEESLTDEELFDNTEATAWNGSYMSYIEDAPMPEYRADEKNGCDLITFSVEGAFDSVDMTKTRIGFAEMDWTSETISFIGYDVTLKGEYVKCEKASQVDAPGEYYLRTRDSYSKKFTDVVVMLAAEDRALVRGIDKFDDIGTSYINPFVLAMEADWYAGSPAQYMVIDVYINKITLNNRTGDVYYLVQNIPDFQAQLSYCTEGSELETIWLDDDYLYVWAKCETVTFCDEEGNVVKVVELTDEVLKNGINASDIIG